MTQQLCQTIDSIIEERWPRYWTDRIATVSSRSTEELIHVIQHVVELILSAARLPQNNGDVLDVIHGIEHGLDPVVTGIYVELAQRLGMQALADLLAEHSPTVEEALATWQTLALPWLHHPLFALSSIQGVTRTQDLGSILTEMLREFQALTLPGGEIRVWRFVNDDSPMIEVTATGTGAAVMPEERPDLARIIHTGEAMVHEERIIIPVRVAKTPFAVVEVIVPSENLSQTILHILTVVRVAEDMLARFATQGQETSPATWQRILANLAQTLTVTHTREEILTTTADLIRQALPCERIAYWEYNADTDEFILRSLSARLTRGTHPVGSRCAAGDTPLQVAWYTGQPLLLGADWPTRFPQYANPHTFINAMAVIPINFEYVSLGILTLERFEARPFTRQEADWLMLVAGMVAVALRNIEIHLALTNAQVRMMEDAKMRALGEMAAGIAHDFNNLLMALMCNVELLGIATELDQVKGRLPRLERAILDARDIVKRISTFGGASSGELMPVALSAVLQDMAELMQPQLEKKAITVVTEYAPDVWVMGNAAELREVVANLITNALFAMQPSGLLTLNCGIHTGKAWFSVRDNGSGMSPAVLTRACDPFFSTKGGLGTGLGLSVSHRIIHRHGGELQIESAEGCGTIITIELPACANGAILSRRESKVTDSRRILLVEDNSSVADDLKQLLEYLGHEVTAVHSASEGIALCVPQQFDLVITDLVLHGETGDAVAHAVRELKLGIPVLLFSGSLNLHEECTNLYDGIICKPVTLEDLRESISLVLPTT